MRIKIGLKEGFLLLIALLFAFYWSNRHLQVTYYTYGDAALPAAFEGCVIVQLSDLHGGSFGEDNAALLQKIEQEEPDYIVITGDLLDKDTENPMDFAAALGERLAAIAPTYFVTGNHEWSIPRTSHIKKALTSAGVTVLSNEFVELTREGERIVLAGVDDINGYADQKKPEELCEEIYETYGDCYWLLLAHRNDQFAKCYCHLQANLTLSGHAHGGLIRLPFTDGLVDSSRTLFPTHTAGFYQMEGAHLLVSRGLGNSGYSRRLFNCPELVVLTLSGQETGDN